MELKIFHAIAAAQSAFIAGKSIQDIFAVLLSDLIKVTQSEYGFIGEVFYENGKPYLKTYAITDISWNDETKALYKRYEQQGMEFRNLNTLFGYAMVSGEPVIANDPANDPRRGGLPPGHPPLNAFLGLPIKFGNLLVGLAGLANRKGGYDAQMVSTLEPLLLMIGQLIDARRARMAADEYLRSLQKIEDYLVRQNELQQMVSQLTAMLLGKSYDALPQVYESVLQVSALTLGADRACILARSFSENTIMLQQQWLHPDRKLAPVIWSADKTPWLMKELQQHSVISVNDIDLLPADAIQDKQFFQQYGCRAFLAYPFQEKENLLGFLFYALTENKNIWNSSDLQPIRLLAELLTSTLIRALKEQALYESEERLKLSQRFANIGIWDWSITSGDLYWSELIGPLFGYPYGEIKTTYDNFLAAVHPDDRQFVTDAVQAAMDGRAAYDIEHRVVWPDGTVHWLSEKGDVVRDSLGKPIRMLGVVQDVTQKKLEQQALQASEQRFRDLLAKVPFAMAVLNRIGDILFLNDQFRSILGYNERQIKHISDWWPLAYPDPDYRREVIEHWNSLVERARQGTGLIVPDEYRVTRADGSEGIFEISGLLIDDYLMATFIDITEKKQAEREVREHQWKLSALFQLSPVGIALNRLSDGKFLEVNSAFARMLGYRTEEITALSYWQLTPQEYAQKEQEQLDSLLKRGFYGPYEKEYICHDGTRIPVLLNGVSFSDTRGEQLIWSVVQDIREWKKVERLKSEFVSTVSHELRTPLTSIVGSLSLLRAGVMGTLTAEQAEIIEIAHNNGIRLSNLINDLLDMEKITSGKMEFNFQTYELKPILEAALETNRHLINDKKISVQLNLNSFYLYVDPLRLQQVFTNLISNAAKFSPEGSKITISAEKTGDKIKVSVADQGRGIPEEFRPRIFQKFSQADASDKKAHGGTGLGLAISRELVEKMNGEIGFISEEGKGSTFYVIFPAVINSGDK